MSYLKGTFDKKYVFWVIESFFINPVEHKKYFYNGKRSYKVE